MERSPFSKLPQELSNAIYSLAMTDTSSIEITKTSPPPLAQTCRQVRAESLAVYYGMNEFSHIIRRPADFRRLRSWLSQQMPSRAKRFRKLEILAPIVRWYNHHDCRDPQKECKELCHALVAAGFTSRNVCFVALHEVENYIQWGFMRRGTVELALKGAHSEVQADKYLAMTLRRCE